MNSRERGAPAAGTTHTPSPADRGRVAGIDTLRAAAALSVFFCHLVPYWSLTARLPGKIPQAFALGAHGVDLFIVISGFCLALPVAGRGLRLDVGAFFIRRAFRILPPYYVALAVATALAMAPSTYNLVVARPASLGDLVQHVLTVQTWTASLGAINGSLWSVALEVHLYVAFPLLVIAWRRWGLAPLVVGCAVLSLVWASLTTGYSGSLQVLPDRLVQFAVGMWCADRLVSDRVPPTKVLVWALALSGTLAVVASTADLTTGTAVLWSIPCACLVLLVSVRLGERLRGGRAERLGAMTFSFYLVHQPVLLLTRPVAARLTDNPYLLIALGATVSLSAAALVALLLYRGVELPAQRLGHAVVARRRTPTVPVQRGGT